MLHYLLTIKKLRLFPLWNCTDHLKVIVLSVFLGIMFNVNLFAQETITGTITSSADNSTLPGVNIIIKGTNQGTISNLEGYYEISASPEDVLVISSLGYLTEEVLVGDQREISISLIEDIAELDEVVVIGYGVQKKKLVTGATSQVKGEELAKRNTTGALQALQGQSAGVNITSTSGQPGEGLKVRVRGVGTIGNSDPLYIVDGVPTGDISYISPTDIESIDVLKDAASAAIYGARGANGVILVTTKKGTAGKNMITFDAYYGVQNVYNKIEMLDAREYAIIMNNQYLNSGGSTKTLPFDITNLYEYTNEGLANTNWIDEMFIDNARTSNYSLGVSGGSENSIYNLSLSYTGQEGVVGGSDFSNYERYSARFSSENSLYDDRIKVGHSITYAHINKNGIAVGDQYSNSLRGAFNTSPFLPMYNNNGEFFNSADTIVDQFGDPYWNDTESNPYAVMTLSQQNDKNIQNFLGNIYATVELARNLKYKSLFGLEYYSYDDRSYTPEYELSVYSFSKYSKASQKMEKSNKILFDNTLTYSNRIGDHNLLGLIGTSMEQYNGAYIYGENAYIAFNDLTHAYLNNATNADNAVLMKIEGAPFDEDKRLSFFGRVQYDYKETYMFNATYRVDGSSKFADGHRWGNFPSVSAGWVISNEDFMAGTELFIDFLKLRASWGQNGSSNAAAFQYVDEFSFTQGTYSFSDEEGVLRNGAYPSRLSNVKLQWEKSEQLNLGFDSRFFKGALVANLDLYRKVTKDWLIPAPIVATAGADAPYINGGNVENKGVELVLSHHGKRGDFQYQVSGNIAYNHNNVTNIPTADSIIHGSSNILYDNSDEFYRAYAGHAIGYFWGYQTDGIFQNTTEVNNHKNSKDIIIQPDAMPGDLRYVDQNDDGMLDDKDKVDIGDPNPDFMFGLNLSCNYKNFDFSVVANGVAGNQIVQSYRNHSNKYANYTAEILDRWTGEGTSNTIPRVTESNVNYEFSDIFVKNGSYLRLSTITFGYNFSNLIKLNSLSQFRLYASAQNLYTFTKYTGMDPEVGFGVDNGETDKFSSGIDLGYYPRPTTFLIGVNLKF